MKKFTHLVLLCAVVVIGLLISPVMAVETAPGEEIYRPFNGAQEHPDIDGNMIVWDDNRYDELNNGVKDIFLATVEEFRSTPPYSYVGTRITDDPASQEKPSISEDYIVWQDNRHGNWDIYLYQHSTSTTTRLTTDSGNQWLPIVRGNYIAWYDSSSGSTNIVLYDIAAGDVKDVINCDAKTTIPYGSTEFKPALSEKYVAWVEEDDGRVYYYDIEAEDPVGPVSTSMAPQTWPSLYGSIIVWEDYRHGGVNPDIYMTDLDNPSAEETQITSDTGEQVSPAISGSIIAWEDKRVPARSIFMYDLSAREELSVVESADYYDEHLYPAVSGNTIVWQRGPGTNSNIYIFAYKPGAPVEPVATSIGVEPPTPTIAVNDTVTFEATVRDQFGNVMTGVEIAWTSGNETVGTVDDTGLFTAHAEGTADVTATAGGVSGSATVTVNAEELVLVSITVTPATATLEINDAEQFSATALDQFGSAMTGVSVTWTSGNETVGTVDTDGNFTAHAGGTTTITASAGDVSGSAAVTVNAAEPTLTDIDVAPTAATLAVGDTEQFTATALDQFGSAMTGVAVTWASSNETVGTIDADGVFAALAGGTTSVTATAGEVSGTATVTVNAAEPTLTDIEIAPTEAVLAVGDIREFVTVCSDESGNIMPGVPVAWACSNETVGTVDTCGVFTALAGGTATITATAGGVSGSATVTVNAKEPVGPVLTRITVTPPTVTLKVGDIQRFIVTAYDQEDIVISAGEVAWASSDDTVGTIDANGLFTALERGTVTLTASVDGVSGTACVTVKHRGQTGHKPPSRLERPSSSRPPSLTSTTTR